MNINLADYRMSERLAFVLESPLKILPPYFERWNYAAKNIGKLISQGILRAFVVEMPILDVGLIASDHKAMRLAHLQLSTMISGFVWCTGEKDVPSRLPSSLAVPFWRVCTKLGFKPGIGSHVGLALANYGLKDEAKALDVDNMEMLYFKFLPDFGNDWFFLLTIQIELDFAKGLQSVLGAVEASKSNDYAKLVKNLDGIDGTIDLMDASLRRMAEHLDPQVFFYGFRPFLAGTTSGLFEKWGGIIFEGIDDEKPKKLVGGSAAQSATLQILDAVLNIHHDKHIAKYCTEVREYILPEHKHFIEWVCDTSRVRDCVKSWQTSKICDKSNFQENQLAAAYNQCVQKLSDFRSRHIRVVTQFIVCPQMKKQQHNEMGNNYKTLNRVGTGGTGIMPFLKSLRDSTMKHVI